LPPLRQTPNFTSAKSGNVMSGNRAGLQFGGTSMRRLSIVFAAAALLASAAVAFAADPIGEYSVEGTNPGGNGKYSGTSPWRKPARPIA
jgi:hypothetical protein